MPTDLTGTPTSLGIGTYNVDDDAPSGLGFNEAMAQIDALLVARTVQISSVFGRTGAITAQAGDYSASEVSNAADLSSGSPQVFAGQVKAPQLAANQIGSGAALVGSTASGAPASGTWSQGNFVIDYTGAVWVCTAAGTPGTWKSVNAVPSVFGRTGAVVAQAGDYTAAQVTNAADKSSSADQVFAGVVYPPQVRYPAASVASNNVTPVVDQSGLLVISGGGLGGGTVTINNPGHFPASGTMLVFSIVLVANSPNSVSGVSWGNAYKFGTHGFNPALASGQSYMWTFIMDGTNGRVVCIGDSGAAY